ncbi:MAG: DUF512 domain-containing protein [Eubacteriaceae bacterium]|nr:DUF512 domain-containing protein [Eubacteriaceae bacterium]
MKYQIQKIEKNSVLDEMGVTSGDFILSINGHPVEDELDIRFFSSDIQLQIEIEKKNGEIWDLDIEKGDEEELGVLFEQTMPIRRCCNQCVFCFIDQMPPGMRKSLYIKDDDERMSFLYGNYVTLTNLSQYEKERIVRYHIMPINISIHTTNSKMRCKMLNNRHAGTIIDDLSFFKKNGVMMNGQIVLCPGYNDGDALRKTLSDLTSFYPQMMSVSVVPVGLTDYREKLTSLLPVNQEIAIETIKTIEECQRKMLIKHHVRFAYPGDEFYLKAGCPFPDDQAYDGFPQIENGVGMIPNFWKELNQNLKNKKNKIANKKHVAIITGKLAESFMVKCCKLLNHYQPNILIDVMGIKNHYFGEKITVSGLLTGRDILDGIEKAQEIEAYYIPENMVQDHSSILLDDITVEMISEKLQRPVIVVPVNGASFVEYLLNESF